MDMHLLTNVVMPNADDNEYRDLFFRMGLIEAGAFGEAYDVWQELHFNTWMNTFSAKKWYRKLYLGLCIKGDFSVELVGSKRNVAYIRLDTKLFYGEYGGDGSWVYVLVEEAEIYDAVYFILCFRKEKPCEILTMGWFTDVAPQMENTMGIVICTYKREQYVRRNITLFETFLKSLKSAVRILLDFDAVRAAYRRQAPMIATRKTWEKYLGI